MTHQEPQVQNGLGALSPAAVELHQILMLLQSHDNEVRGLAESQFNQAKEHKGLCLDALTTLTTAPDNVNEVVRAQAAVLLRRSASDLWEGADDEVRRSVMSRLLMGIRLPFRKDMRKKICDTVAVIGAPLVNYEPSQWPELLPTLFELNRSTASHERENSLYIISQIADYLDVKVVGPHLGTLKASFQAGLHDSDAGVQLAALRAICAILNMLESGLCPNFEDLIPSMLQPVHLFIQARKEDEARAAIELLIEVAETEPKFWKSHLPVVCPLMIHIASNSKIEDDDSASSIRQLALEFLITVAEKLPSQCRKMGTFVHSVFPIGLSMMLELEDDPSWNEHDDDDDSADQYNNYEAGRESLDRIAIALGGKSVLPVAESIIPPFLANEDWKHRHAALLAISQIGEGCQRQIEAKLEQVIAMALNRFADPHPRVRWAAINCIGQMCTDFGPAMQEQFHPQIVPSLIAVMDDTGNPRVQSHAAAAVINFCDEASPAIIAPYLNPLLSKLQALLQSNVKLTQEQAVTAIAAVADCADSQFTVYYDQFMPVLKQVLSTTSGHKDLRRLRGKVMECISLIGLSVGREKFRADAADVMNILVATTNSQAAEDTDDPQSFYLMQAYARICRCLKGEFIMYLPHVMPRVMAAASQKPEIDVLDALDDDGDGAEDEEGYETIKIGDKRIGIRTSALEDKATACTMLSCFVAELRGGFMPYVEQVAQLMVPLLKFFYHDECRTAAASCMSDLVRCLLEGGTTAQVATFVNYVLPHIADAIKNEPDVDVEVTMVESLCQIADITSSGVISANVQREVTEALVVAVMESDQRTSERLATADEDQWDDEEREDAELEGQKDEELLARIGDVFGALLKVHCSAGYISTFMNAVRVSETTVISPFTLFWNKLNATVAAHERHVALCVFDDFIQHGGEQSLMYIPKLLPAMQVYSADPNPDVRQAAIFGVGLCAQLNSEHFAQAAGNIVAVLEQVVSSPHSRNEENEMATDNAVSSLFKILEFQPKCLPGDAGAKVGGLIVHYLPMNADDAESKVVHAALIRAIERSDIRILGENVAHLPKILAILGDILGTGSLDDEYSARAVLAVKTMQNQYPADVLQRATAALTEEQRAKLAQAVQS